MKSDHGLLHPKKSVKMCVEISPKWRFHLKLHVQRMQQNHTETQSAKSFGPCFPCVCLCLLSLFSHVCLLAISHTIPPSMGHYIVMPDTWSRMYIHVSGVTYPMRYPGPWGRLSAGHSFYFPSKKIQFCRNTVFYWKIILTVIFQRASPVSFMCRKMKLIIGQSSPSKQGKEM